MIWLQLSTTSDGLADGAGTSAAVQSGKFRRIVNVQSSTFILTNPKSELHVVV